MVGKFIQLLGCCLLGLSLRHAAVLTHPLQKFSLLKVDEFAVWTEERKLMTCLLYTSDAADEL